MKSKIQFLLAFAMMFVMLGAFEALAQVPQLLIIKALHVMLKATL